MKKKAVVEKYYITNGSKYLGHVISDSKVYTINVPVSGAKRFKLETANCILPLVNDNSCDDWCIQKYYNVASKNNYVITTATKFVGYNGVVVNDVTKARSFKTAADAAGYIQSHGDLYLSMGEPIIVNNDYDVVDNFGRKKNSIAAAKQIDLDRKSGVQKSKRIHMDKNMRISVYQRDNGICQICGKPLGLDDFTVDHIVPLNRGGLNDMSNYRCVCWRCNEWKRDSLDEELVTMLEEVSGNYLYKHPDSNMMNRMARMWLRGKLRGQLRLQLNVKPSAESKKAGVS